MDGVRPLGTTGGIISDRMRQAADPVSRYAARFGLLLAGV